MNNAGDQFYDNLLVLARKITQCAIEIRKAKVLYLFIKVKIAKIWYHKDLPRSISSRCA